MERWNYSYICPYLWQSDVFLVFFLWFRAEYCLRIWAFSKKLNAFMHNFLQRIRKKHHWNYQSSFKKKLAENLRFPWWYKFQKQYSWSLLAPDYVCQISEQSVDIYGSYRVNAMKYRSRDISACSADTR